MSDVVLVALITGGVGLAGLAFNFLNIRGERAMRLTERQEEREEQQTEREERYKFSLYDRRLAVHQEAYEWMIALIEPFQRALEITTNDRDLPDNFPLSGQYAEARQWWFSNCLYLDEKSRACTIDLIENIGAFLRLEERPSFDKVYAIYLEAIRSIPAGLGMKHVEATERLDD